MTDSASSRDVNWGDVAAVNAAMRGTLIERMGIWVTEISADRAVATMPVEGNTQPYGLLHGGASAVLAETIGSVLCVVCAGPSRAAVGVDINATHHRATRQGLVTAVATPAYVGQSMATVDIVITDDSGTRVCTSRLTAQLRSAPPGAESAPR